MAGPQDGISGDATIGVQVRNLVSVVEATIQRTKEASSVVEASGLEKGLRREPGRWDLGS